jgi:Domain of unknown function (DUF3291)
MEFHLAEFNIARLKMPLEAAANAEFVAVLEPVNLLAEASEGFVWRLTDDGGLSSTYVVAYDDPQTIVNLTVWQSVESLKHFVYRSGHGSYFRRRTEWFEPSTDVNMVCWWVRAGELPTVDDAVKRLDHLRAYGQSEQGFLFTEPVPRPID